VFLLFICGHEVHFAVRLRILGVVHWTSVSWSVRQMVRRISGQWTGKNGEGNYCGLFV